MDERQRKLPTPYPPVTQFRSQPMSSTNLHGELVEEILKRLSVKSLLRFRCVSKSWKALIDSSYFTNLHLYHSSDYYLFRPLEYKSPREFKLINMSNQALDSIHRPGRALFPFLSLPLSSTSYVQVLGSCNGLIAFQSSSLKEIILVNPSTSEYQLLPPIAKKVRSPDVGLGYDCFADEYKVVVKPSKVPRKGVEVNIWGSKSNSWRKIRCSLNYNHKNLYRFSSHGKYTHGALHWIAGDKVELTNSLRINRIQIDAFDLETEKFMSTEYDGEVFGYPFTVDLEVLGECLCLCCQHHNSGGGVVDIWVMKKYGVMESWGKLASLPSYTIPLTLSACGRRLLLAEHDLPKSRWYLRSYDVNKQSMECFGSIAATMNYNCRLCYCAQSLVRLPEKLSQHVAIGVL